MTWKQRPVVKKGDCLVALVHDQSGCLPRNDLAKRTRIAGGLVSLCSHHDTLPSSTPNEPRAHGHRAIGSQYHHATRNTLGVNANNLSEEEACSW